MLLRSAWWCRLAKPANEAAYTAAQFRDSNGHHQRRGERWSTTQQAFSSDVALLRIARRLDAIVLQVDWRRYNEHLFVREEDEVDSMFRKLLKQQPQCRFRDTVYSIISMTEKTISGVHVSPGSAETLVGRGGISNHL